MDETHDLVELIGVYHADGGLLGELRYVAGKLRGTAHCALCDITHGRLSAKQAWKECRDSFAAPMRVVHLNERTPAEAQFTDGHTPCVVGRYADGSMRLLLDPAALDDCGGSVDLFVARLASAIES